MPAAAMVPVSELRTKVYFGPTQISLKPVPPGNGESPPGLIDTPPNLFMTTDHRSVMAKRAWRPKNSALPPRNAGLEPGIVWYRKIGRTSVSERGSSNRNGFDSGEMNVSKQWSLSKAPSWNGFQSFIQSPKWLVRCRLVGRSAALRFDVFAPAGGSS